MKTISKEVLYLGLDVHAENIAVAIAEAGRDGEVRNYGEIPNTFHSVDKLMRKLGDPDKELRVCSGECLASFLTPRSQNAAIPIPRPSPQDRIRHKAAPPRSNSRNPARSDPTPSKNRGKAFPKE
jgi:hypothetical protein